MSIEPEKMSFVTGREMPSSKVIKSYIYEIYGVEVVILSDTTMEGLAEMVRLRQERHRREPTSNDEFLHRRRPHRTKYRSYRGETIRALVMENKVIINIAIREDEEVI